MEMGYRCYGTDLMSGDTPDEAGLVFCADVEMALTGREALLERRRSPLTRRVGTLLVGGTEYRTVYGGEAAQADGEVVGRLRSAAYGFTVGRSLAYAYLPATIGPGDRPAVEVFGELVDAEVADDVQYDPMHERVRA
jgi:glycine cleavage system aminomethyltransferase T